MRNSVADVNHQDGATDARSLPGKTALGFGESGKEQYQTEEEKQMKQSSSAFSRLFNGART
jgi:hypothetical protein